LRSKLQTPIYPNKEDSNAKNKAANSDKTNKNTAKTNGLIT